MKTRQAHVVFAIVSAGSLLMQAGADTVTLNLAGSSDGRSAAVSFVMDDAAGTMTVRVRNTMTGDGQAFRNISGLFWSFTGASMDIAGAGSNGALAGASTSGLTPWAQSSSSVTPAQLWAFRDPGTASAAFDALGATQGLAVRGLTDLWGSTPASALAGGSGNTVGGSAAFIRGNVGGSGARSDDGTLVSASGSRVADGRDQFRDYVEFNFSNLGSFYASYGGARNVGVNQATAQFGGQLGDPHVALLVVPLPTAAWAGLGTLGGLAAFRAVRRRHTAR